EIKENAKKTAKLADGMPYFKLNNYTSSGFDLSWGWDYVKMYFTLLNKVSDIIEELKEIQCEMEEIYSDADLNDTEKK
ncbi:hypothetical protein, partial [Methanobrevibacter sp.]|uniref:hypothetical protein n=1 Tax=Methanobrevibacter sp. TaxID=66852 RepID=UPI00388FCD6A